MAKEPTDTEEGIRRTKLQNKSLHKYLTSLSGGLNDGGFSQRATMEKFKKDFDIPWTMSSLKEIFREIGFIMFDKESTSDLTTIEMQKVYDIFDLRFGEITGVSFDWPSVESMQFEKDGYIKK